MNIIKVMDHRTSNIDENVTRPETVSDCWTLISGLVGQPISSIWQSTVII